MPAAIRFFWRDQNFVVFGLDTPGTMALFGMQGRKGAHVELRQQCLIHPQKDFKFLLGFRIAKIAVRLELHGKPVVAGKSPWLILNELILIGIFAMVRTMEPAEDTKRSQEWLKQAIYDMKTAEAMFNSKRYIYAVFMCHLSIEKVLKGLYTRILTEVPPKSHNLIFLIEKMKLELPENYYDFIFTLNGLSVPTRYPDDLQKLLKEYTKAKTGKVLEQAKEVLRWLRTKL